MRRYEMNIQKVGEMSPRNERRRGDCSWAKTGGAVIPGMKGKQRRRSKRNTLGPVFWKGARSWGKPKEEDKRSAGHARLAGSADPPGAQGALQLCA
eukprot:4397669-Alexandrium_andersonii.AAC.1